MSNNTIIKTCANTGVCKEVPAGPGGRCRFCNGVKHDILEITKGRRIEGVGIEVPPGTYRIVRTVSPFKIYSKEELESLKD